ncbi:TRAG family protein [Leptospirillum ferriphilum]|nr:type IV secretory system conjugative DNA transfer family protein [Leptospirillum ferriphilum]KGA93894.1 TRAG family protein [Leptospirillum ferriphilum]
MTQKNRIAIFSGILSLLSGHAIGSWRTAALSGYQSALGDPPFHVFGAPVYLNPANGLFVWTSEWFRLWQNAGWFGADLKSGYLYLLVSGIGVFIGLYPLMLRIMPEEKSINVHGSSRWATLADIRKMGILEEKAKNPRVIIGAFGKKWHFIKIFEKFPFLCIPVRKPRILFHSGPTHILLVAPTRSGKGVSVIIPTLFEWVASVVVLDIKAENYGITSGFRKSMGQRILRFNPACDDPDQRTRYNPLMEIDKNGPNEIRDAQNIALAIMDPEGTAVEKDPFWTRAAAELLTAIILFVVHFSRNPSLYEVSRVAANKRLGIMQMMKLIVERVDEKERELTEKGEKVPEAYRVILASAREIMGQAEETASSITKVMSANLFLFRDPLVAANTMTSDFRLSDLMGGLPNEKDPGPVSLYLTVQAGDLTRFRPLLKIIVQQIIGKLAGEMKYEKGKSVNLWRRKLLLLLDEFPRLGRMDEIEGGLAFVGGYGINIMTIIQSFAQLKPQEYRDAILSNSQTKIAYANGHPEDAKLLSEMTGNSTVKKELSSRSPGRGFISSVSRSEQVFQRAVMTTDEIQQMSDAEGLLMISGQRPIRVDKIRYYEDPVMKTLAEMGSPEKVDRIPGRGDVPWSNEGLEDIEDYIARIEKELEEMKKDGSSTEMGEVEEEDERELESGLDDDPVEALLRSVPEEMMQKMRAEIRDSRSESTRNSDPFIAEIESLIEHRDDGDVAVKKTERKAKNVPLSDPGIDAWMNEWIEKRVGRK